LELFQRKQSDDKINILNQSLNDEVFRKELSFTFHNTPPILVLDTIVDKKTAQNILFQNQRIDIALKDSTQLGSWKRDWLHPKFYISVDSFKIAENNAHIELTVHSVGKWFIFTYQKQGEWVKIKEEVRQF
jgi:hypothetical protein